MAQDQKNGGKNGGSKASDPPPLKGVTAAKDRTAVYGPNGPTVGKSSRQALCDMLNLKDPTDQQLFTDAALRIAELETQLSAKK